MNKPIPTASSVGVIHKDTTDSVIDIPIGCQCPALARAAVRPKARTGLHGRGVLVLNTHGFPKVWRSLQLFPFFLSPIQPITRTVFAISKLQDKCHILCLINRERVSDNGRSGAKAR